MYVFSATRQAIIVVGWAVHSQSILLLDSAAETPIDSDYSTTKIALHEGLIMKFLFATALYLGLIALPSCESSERACNPNIGGVDVYSLQITDQKSRLDCDGHWLGGACYKVLGLRID